MGVSLQQYRSHIGIYNSSGRIKLNKKKQGYSNNNIKSKPLNFLLLLFFFSMCNPIVQDYNRRPAFNLHQTFCSFLPYVRRRLVIDLEWFYYAWYGISIRTHETT